MPPNWK
jgi:hypothetical protein